MINIKCNWNSGLLHIAVSKCYNISVDILNRKEKRRNMYKFKWSTVSIIVKERCIKQCLIIDQNGESSFIVMDVEKFAKMYYDN